MERRLDRKDADFKATWAILDVSTSPASPPQVPSLMGHPC